MQLTAQKPSDSSQSPPPSKGLTVFSDYLQLFLRRFLGHRFRHRAIARIITAVVTISTIVAFVLSLRTSPILAFDPVTSATQTDIEVDGGLRGEHIHARVRVGTPPRTKDDCQWSKTNWTSTMRPHYPMLNNATPPEDIGYDAYVKTCTTPKKELFLYWIHDSVFSTVGKAAEDAIDRLIPNPSVQIAPAASRNVVTVGTWFWFNKSAWKTVSVTAYVPTKVGVISATTSATPKKIIFSPGDGRLGSGNITCDGPGAPWRPQIGDRARTSCMYTYRRASHGQPRGVFNAKVSIEWDISVKTSMSKTPISYKQKVSTVRTSTTVPIRVLEIQALTR
jgi:hypothetical protein